MEGISRATPAPIAERGDKPRVLILCRQPLRAVVLIEPVVRAIVGTWRDASITLLVDKAHADVVGLMLLVDRVLTLSEFAPPRECWRALRVVRQARFTHVIDLENDPVTALLTRFSEAHERRTIVLGARRVRLPFCYTDIVVPSFEDRSLVETYFDAMPAAVPRAELRQPQLHPRPAGREWARCFIRDLVGNGATPPFRARVLLIHVGVDRDGCGWPPESFVELICRVRAELDLLPVLVGGIGDEARIERIASACVMPIATTPVPLEVPLWAALASEVGLALCQGGGPMQVAAAAGARVVALFGCQSVRIWRPLGWGHAVLEARESGTDDVIAGIRSSVDSCRGHCLRGIAAESALAALRQRCAPAPCT